MSGYLDRPKAEVVGLPDKAPISTFRVVLAFILTPILASIAFAAYEPAYEGLPNYLDRVFRTAFLYALFGAVPATIVLGIPAFLILRKLLRPSVLNCALAGALVAALPWVILMLDPGSGFASTNGRATIIDGKYTAYGWLEFGQFVLLIAAAGAVGGIIFWLIGVAKWPWRQT